MAFYCAGKIRFISFPSESCGPKSSRFFTNWRRESQIAKEQRWFNNCSYRIFVSFGAVKKLWHKMFHRCGWHEGARSGLLRMSGCDSAATVRSGEQELIVVISGESQQQCLQRLCHSWQGKQAWSGRRESNSRSQLGKLLSTTCKCLEKPSSQPLIM